MLENILDGIHVALTRRRYLQLFTAFTRVLLALGFIPPSISKILHRPFTVLPDSNPVGAYFNALYNTGFYYEFLGWAQIIAAALLLMPRTAHIGALMFLPIIVNIAILTSSVGFRGTWLLTIFMSLAGLWLVSWEYDRLKPIIFQSRTGKSARLPYQWILIPIFFAVGGVVITVLSWYIRLGNFFNYLNIGAFLAIGGLIFGLLVALHYSFMPVGDLKETGESL